VRSTVAVLEAPDAWLLIVVGSTARAVELLAAEGKDSVMIQMPTGGGKTRTMMHMLCDLLEKEGPGGAGRVLWLAHAEELCFQALETFELVWSHIGVGAMEVIPFWGGANLPNNLSGSAFVVGGFSKVHRLQIDKPEVFEELLRGTSVVVIDEAHKGNAPTIKAILRAAKAMGIPTVGLSATPGRGLGNDDNVELVELFGGNLIGCDQLGADPIRELQERGVLSKVVRKAHQSSVTLGPVNVGAGAHGGLGAGLSKASLRNLARDPRRNQLIGEIVATHVSSNRPTLVFACSVEHACLLALQAAAAGISATYVHCEMSRGGRRRVLKSFCDGEVSCLFNYGVLSTGFDAPLIGAVVITRPTTSGVLYSQMIGRGMRGAKVGGTEEVHLSDVVDNMDNFGGAAAIYESFGKYW
jgi:superfamily II DNA or RNA helicase